MTVTAGNIGVLCIGASTGGPGALADVLSGFCEPLAVPILIVQHMPANFTKMLAERLGKCSCMRCSEAEEHQLLEAGRIYLAPGGRHLEVVRDGSTIRTHIHDGPPENSCRPSVDVLFRSVVSIFGSGTLAVVLTGMGQDGKRGCELIREAGGQILAQNEATSVVWGMPGVITKAGLADAVLPISELANEVIRRLAASS